MRKSGRFRNQIAAKWKIWNCLKSPKSTKTTACPIQFWGKIWILEDSKIKMLSSEKFEQASKLKLNQNYRLSQSILKKNMNSGRFRNQNAVKWNIWTSFKVQTQPKLRGPHSILKNVWTLKEQEANSVERNSWKKSQSS